MKITEEMKKEALIKFEMACVNGDTGDIDDDTYETIRALLQPSPQPEPYPVGVDEGYAREEWHKKYGEYQPHPPQPDYECNICGGTVNFCKNAAPAMEYEMTGRTKKKPDTVTISREVMEAWYNHLRCAGKCIAADVVATSISEILAQAEGKV